MKIIAQSLVALSVLAIGVSGFQSAFALEQAASTAGVWNLDPAHSSVRFTVKHMMVSNVPGSFGKVSGTAKYDGKDLKGASVEATIDVNSINTNDEHRDGHLKTKDFFDAAQFPTITFKSKKVTPEAKGAFKVLGDLTMHGVTKEVTLDVDALAPAIKGMKGELHTGTSATAVINRKDFGLTWNKNLDNGGTMIGDEVKVSIDVDLAQRAESEAKPEAKPEAKAKG